MYYNKVFLYHNAVTRKAKVESKAIFYQQPLKTTKKRNTDLTRFLSMSN